MLVNEDMNNNSKQNFAQVDLPLYFSPYIHKKKSIGNLYTEPRKIPIEKDSRNNKKINYSIKISNSNIKVQQDSLTKSLKLTTENNKKGRNMHQSYAKLNTKLYLKKNAIPNLASFHDLNSNYPPTPLMKNSVTNIIVSSSIKSTEKNQNLSVGKNKNKNQNKNIKLIFGKNSNNNYNTNINNNNSNSNLLKKQGGSVNELFRNNFIKKTKTKNPPELNNINNIGFIISTSGNNNSANKAPFLSPQNIPGQKIIFLKKDKSKIKESKEKSRKNSTSNTKEQKKNSQNKKSGKSVAMEDLNLNLDDQNKSVQYLLRNTYNNVKIYPIRCKTIIVGNSGVGKTSIISRYLRKFNPKEKSTIGASFTNKIEIINNRQIIFEIWDTAGQERFRSINTIFYQDAYICLLVYDITSKQSFEDIKSYWYNSVVEQSSKNILFHLVGNKMDLLEEETVEKKDVEAYGKEIDAEVSYISAKDENNIYVDMLFQKIGEKFINSPLLKELEENSRSYRTEKVKLDNEGESIADKKNRSCC